LYLGEKAELTALLLLNPENRVGFWVPMA
jgi:hypothetical protein